MKVKNVSGKVKHFKINKSWISIEHDEIIEVPDNVIEAEEGLEEVKEKIEEKVKEFSTIPVHVDKKDDKKDEYGKYSKTDIVDMKKSEQVDILKKMGVVEKIIKSLKTEAQRVAKILKLQG